jgi:hypothetical protein
MVHQPYPVSYTETSLQSRGAACTASFDGKYASVEWSTMVWRYMGSWSIAPLIPGLTRRMRWVSSSCLRRVASSSRWISWTPHAVRSLWRGKNLSLLLEAKPRLIIYRSARSLLSVCPLGSTGSWSCLCVFSGWSCIVVSKEKCRRVVCSNWSMVVYFVFLYYYQLMHNYFTNDHTPTCFDTLVSSSGGL